MLKASYTCLLPGLFANPDATGCTSYILCDSYDLKSFKRNCPPDTYFWPLNKGCFSHYNCSTDSMPDGDNTNPCIGWGGTQIIDKYSSDCSSYIHCRWEYIGTNDYILNGERYDCPSGTSYLFNEGCRDNYQCTNYQCTAEGYFADPSVSDCSRFIICKKNINPYTGATTVYPIFTTCPANTKFSPFSKNCDEFYTCDGNNPHSVADPWLNYNWAFPTAENPITFPLWDIR